MVKHYLEWSRREPTLKRKLLAVIPVGLIIVGVIPYVLFIILPKVDATLHLPMMRFGAINWIIGGLLLIAGGVFGLWSVFVQLFRADGTPVPMAPTRRLLVDGPFKYCRNPMTLGTILAYSGVSLLVGSLASFVAVILIGSLLLVYIRFVEEKELEARFGQAYADYKRVTPFIIPKVW